MAKNNIEVISAIDELGCILSRLSLYGDLLTLNEGETSALTEASIYTLGITLVDEAEKAKKELSIIGSARSIAND